MRRMTNKLRGSSSKKSKSKKSLTFAPSDSIAVTTTPSVPQGPPLVIDAPENTGFSSGAESDAELAELRQQAAQIQAEEADARKAERRRREEAERCQAEEHKRRKEEKHRQKVEEKVNSKV